MKWQHVRRQRADGRSETPLNNRGCSLFLLLRLPSAFCHLPYRLTSHLTRNKLNPRSPFKILISGIFPRHRVKINWNDEERVLPAGLQTKIDQFWQKESTRQPHLFNGDLCRLNRWEKKDNYLILDLGRTDYREQWHSNAFCREIVSKHGEEVLARALGVSAVLATRDQQIVLIKRSHEVGEDPGKLDVWGGHIHPQDHAIDGAPDPFCAIAAEILEEANLTLSEDEPLTCLGLIETTTTFKPEMIFRVELQLTAAEVMKRAEAYGSAEWSALISIANRSESLKTFLQEHEEQISPSAFGALWLHHQLIIDY